MNEVFIRFGKLMDKLDSYERIETEEDVNLVSYEMFTKVWPEARRI